MSRKAPIPMMLLILLSCRQTMQRMNDYLDRELNAREMKWVRSHLAICHACTAKFAFEAEWTAALRAKLDHAALHASPELPAQVFAAVHQAAQRDEANDSS